MLANTAWAGGPHGAFERTPISWRVSFREVKKCGGRAIGQTLAVALLVMCPAAALDPHKLLTQYSRSFWNQEQGLPQDTVFRLAQTGDGFLWAGTSEGLVRFDGYEFVVYDRANAGLPANHITALRASSDNSLWIGTPNGLALYRAGQFRIFTTLEGLPDNAISMLYEDRNGALWIAAGLFLARYEAGKFTTYAPGRDIPVRSVRVLCGDRGQGLWVAGFGGVAKLADGKFVRMIDAETLSGNVPSNMLVDRDNNLWVAGSQGILVRTAAGEIRRYDSRQGLPDNAVRVVFEDGDGNVWAGTNGGLARFSKGRFISLATPESPGRDQVFSIYEDAEHNLWVGASSGLTRFRDDIFTVYGTSEGLPSDTPSSVFQDHAGRIWVGFHSSGLMLFSGLQRRLYTRADGLPANEIFSIRESRDGRLLLSTPAGLAQMGDAGFSIYRPPDPLARGTVYDALEDSGGRLWLATPNGLGRVHLGKFEVVIPGGPLVRNSFGVLAEGRSGRIWAGTLGQGFWLVENGSTRPFRTDDGLSNNSIRSLLEDRDGMLWIGTFGGGLNSFRDGKFHPFTARDGLLSDNIAHITDSGEYLWLSTTRGICRVSKKQLQDFADGRVTRLTPANFGFQDGLRSAQSGPSHPVAAGGTRTSDGRLWFPTSRGLAVLDPRRQKRPLTAPPVHILDMKVEGRIVESNAPIRLPPGTSRIQLRFAAIHLSAPEQLEYSYKLEGLDSAWVNGGNRRVIDYSGLRPGKYRFLVSAKLPGGPVGERTQSFELLPHFYETKWFLGVCAALLVAAVAGAYQLRLRTVRARFRLVLEERARIAREIHDTLAQGFTGISSQLDAVAMCIPEEGSPARQHLDLARRMARHSITEARRSVMDLRTAALEGRDLAAALEAGARVWAATSGTDVEVDISPPQRMLPQDVEQHLLRIAQEAVANALKHAGATKIRVRLHCDAHHLYLHIADDGRGFDNTAAFSLSDGHFGLLGMRERAQRVRGELRLDSKSGQGTSVEVMVPL